jgi:hypothetical protein
MNHRFLCLCLVLTFGFTLSAAAQQTVNRFDLFTGYSHLSSPGVSLEQNGFNTSFGVNVTRWLALGADFSVFTGDGSINVADTKVAGLVAPFLPPGIPSPSIPFSAKTYTFAAGPQINIRHFEKVMFFVRPGLGAIHERATLNVPIALQPLLPLIPGISTKMTDTVPFYGFGGGADINASKHVGLRFSVDFVHTSLFSSLLDSRNAVRFSVGPTFKWGELK